MRGVAQCFLSMFWLAGQAVSGLGWFWPVTLILAALFFGAVWLDYRRSRIKFDFRLFWLLLPVLGIVVVLGTGAFFWEEEKFRYLADVGLGLAALLAVVAVVVFRRAWFTSVSSSLCLLWYALWCWFVAVMAITGDWL